MAIPLRFSEALVSRLCHDLVTPIGATQTGLELLAQTNPSHLTEFQEILNLILHSTETLAARTSFFRAAFGTNGNTLHLEDIKTLVSNYLSFSKLKVSWEDCKDKDSTKGWGSLILNLILWLNESAPSGGTLAISFPSKSPFAASFQLKGDPLLFHQGTLEILRGEDRSQELSPRTVPCYLIRYLLEEKQASLSLDSLPSSTILTLDLKA